MVISRMKKIAMGLGFYCATIAINYISHVTNATSYSIEAENYSGFVLENGSLKIRNEYLLLVVHQKRTLEELTKPWLFVPGSVIWRWVERPNLEYQKRNEVYEGGNNEPIITQI